MRALVQEPMNTRSSLRSVDRRRRPARPMYSSALGGRLAVGRVGEVGRVGHLAGDRRDLAGVGAPGDLRRDVGGVEHERLVVLGAGVGRQLAASGRRPRRSRLRGELRGRGDSRRSSRRGRSCRPGRRPRSTCCRRSSALPCVRPRIASPVYSMHVAGAAVGGDLADQVQDQVLGRDAAAAAGRRRAAPASWACTAAASAWPARARLRWCRCRTPARRTRRAWPCGCRRRRSSCPAACRPSSGPMTCTMPCCGSSRSYSADAELAAVLRAACRSAACEIGSAIGRLRSVVGTLWSGVATVSSGRRTLRPASRKPSNACGLVTSCTRCRSM